MRIVLILFLLMYSSIAAAGDQPLRKASFMPLWSTQTQFAGYYVALDKGIYEKYGIDLSIVPGGPERPAADFLMKKKVDFTVLWLSTAIQRRAQGLKLVNIGQIVQKSAIMLVAKKSSGIKTYADLDNKKVSLWEGDLSIQPRMFFRKHNLKVKIIPQSSSINLFLRGGTDVASAMWYNEYHTILNSGLDPDELTTFFFHEHGLNFPEDGIYTLEETFMKDPGLSCAFVKASVEGWVYAFEHPGEAVDIVLKYMVREKIPANRMHQKWMLERMKDLITEQGATDKIGMLKQQDYELVADELRKEGMIKSIPAFPAFYRQCTGYVQK
ncbi:MAG: ABC transporter substrate-binding protein [Nitrospirae bacterium]|nr:ABC transporter substrate-binding protein [Nitrospirota bacterium]